MFDHIQVESKEGDEPYAEHIRRWFLAEFTGSVMDKSDTLELVFEAFMASSKIRLGPRPSPESQVAIREVLRYYTGRGTPIPVLVPWGSEKPDEGPVDIAEVGGLRTLYDLSERVRKYYSPGIEVRIRVEDASAPHLFFHRAEASARASRLYTTHFSSLVHLLGPPILAAPESLMMRQLYKYDFDQAVRYFGLKADEYVPHIERYIAETDLYGMKDYEHRASYKKLQELGWAGEIPPAQRDYYRSTYAKLYNIDPKGERATHTLARYFAESLTRGKLGMTGVDPGWKEGGYIQISLVPPVPGAPVQRTGRTIYYRTLPENVSSTHIPPWRSLGYLEIREDGSTRPHQTTPRLVSSEGMILHPAYVTMCSMTSPTGDRIPIYTPYVLKEK